MYLYISTIYAAVPSENHFRTIEIWEADHALGKQDATAVQRHIMVGPAASEQNKVRDRGLGVNRDRDRDSRKPI